MVDPQKDIGSHPHYKWVNNHLNKKGKIVVDNYYNPQHTLIYMYHDSTIRGIV